jgi:hypothetical protein
VADPLVIDSDLELFLTGWYRTALAGTEAALLAARIGASSGLLTGVEVDNKEPADPPFPAKLLVIRDDGGPASSQVTGERSVGLTVLAGSKLAPKDANDLIRIVLALVVLIPAPDAGETPRNPVSAVLERNGPFPVVEEQDRARRFATVVFAVTPQPI